MKRTISALLAVLLIISALAGCAGGGFTTGASSAAAGTAPSADASSGGGYYDKAESESGTGIVPTVSKSVPLSEKIIYTADADIETTDFDNTIAKISAMLTEYGAFLESSSISGSDYTAKYYGYQTFRSASFAIRVPVDKFEAMTGSLDTLGNVTSSSTGTQNITAQYTDTESRLKTYRTEEERLLAMLEKADTVTDMIAIEERLSDVRYQIESLTSTLTNWQNEVDYSTVNLHIQEVRELTELIPTQRSYWQEVGDGFMGTLKDVGKFFTNLFKGFVTYLPALAVTAAVLAVIAVIVRKAIPRVKKRRDGGSDGKQ